MLAHSWDVLKINSSLEAHSSDRLHQRSGVQESRVRGGAASWPSLAAVVVCGGVQSRRGMQSRGARTCRVRGVGGLTCHCALATSPRKTVWMKTELFGRACQAYDRFDTVRLFETRNQDYFVFRSRFPTGNQAICDVSARRTNHGTWSWPTCDVRADCKR